MRRVLFAIGATVAGLVALLSYKSHTGLPNIPVATGASVAAAPGHSASAAPGGNDPAPVVLTGKVYRTKFGPVQVQVTMVNHRIVKVKVLQLTDLGSVSGLIDAHAIPVLNKETITAQSAKIDMVSHATYTSTGYIGSLQSALDQA